MRLLKDLVGRAPFIPPFTTAAFPALTNTDTNKLEIERAQRTAFQESKRGYPPLYSGSPTAGVTSTRKTHL